MVVHSHFCKNSQFNSIKTSFGEVGSSRRLDSFPCRSRKLSILYHRSNLSIHVLETRFVLGHPNRSGTIFGSCTWTSYLLRPSRAIHTTIVFRNGDRKQRTRTDRAFSSTSRFGRTFRHSLRSRTHRESHPSSSSKEEPSNFVFRCCCYGP